MIESNLSRIEPCAFCEIAGLVLATRSEKCAHTVFTQSIELIDGAQNGAAL